MQAQRKTLSLASLALRLAVLMAVVLTCWRTGVTVLPGSAPESRIALGAGLSCAVLITVLLLARFDRLPRAVLGHHGAAANARAFLLGVALWLVPALIGIGLCVALGWATVSLRASPGECLGTLALVGLAVFLVEAFPEELAMRGYVQGMLGTRFPPWVALLLQAALFLGFAWALGAMSTPSQQMLLPGFALILGYARAVGGSVWVPMGVHAAWMTTTQAMSPGYGLVVVEGLQALQFIAFALLPSAAIGSVLAIRAPGFSWTRRAQR
ncbi:CPBP family intramembrane glutamic endopeptidase [Luteimonas sp. A501]